MRQRLHCFWTTLAIDSGNQKYHSIMLLDLSWFFLHVEVARVENGAPVCLGWTFLFFFPLSLYSCVMPCNFSINPLNFSLFFNFISNLLVDIYFISNNLWKLKFALISSFFYFSLFNIFVCKKKFWLELY
jgi:hypothetical protein